MQISRLTDADLADDEVMRARWELNRRSQLHGRESMPFWSFHEYAGGHRSPDSGERQELLDARDGDRLLATAAAWMPLLDNTEKVWFEVDVDPEARRQGIGTALVEAVTALAREAGRDLLLTSAHVPMQGRAEHGYPRFAEAVGFSPSIDEVLRHLPLPVAEATLQGWLDHAAEKHDGYTLETYVDEVPEPLVASLCLLLGQLAVDAPSGTVDFEEELVTPQRYADLVATTRAMGRARYETLALTPDREVVAQSTLAVPLGEGDELFQWGTFVHREHRGHRLGLAVKAANLRAAQEARPDATLVTTQNAETNGFMVSINEQMGFEAVEAATEFVKRL